MAIDVYVCVHKLSVVQLYTYKILCEMYKHIFMNNWKKSKFKNMHAKLLNVNVVMPMEEKHIPNLL